MNSRRLCLCLALGSLVVGLAGCASFGPKGPDVESEEEYVQRGQASWYGPQFHGRRTASGETYNMHRLTAAHPTLPFGSIVKVRNLDNGKSVRVRINDRGPFARGRVIDLSYVAARRIAMVGPGTARVEIRVIHRTDERVRVAGYVVQVGAFRDASHAEAMRARLEADYDQVRVEREGVWNRVLVGRYRDRREAERTLDELLGIGFVALVRAE